MIWDIGPIIYYLGQYHSKPYWCRPRWFYLGMCKVFALCIDANDIKNEPLGAEAPPLVGGGGAHRGGGVRKTSEDTCHKLLLFKVIPWKITRTLKHYKKQCHSLEIGGPRLGFRGFELLMEKQNCNQRYENQLRHLYWTYRGQQEQHIEEVSNSINAQEPKTLQWHFLLKHKLNIKNKLNI